MTGPRAVLRRAALGAVLALAAAPAARAQAQKKEPRGARPADRAGDATPRRTKAQKAKAKKPGQAPREQVFDFTGLELQGSMRTPQLLYFLDRASQELERASLERRSFVPELIRSLDEEGL